MDSVGKGQLNFLLGLSDGESVARELGEVYMYSGACLGVEGQMLVKEGNAAGDRD